MRCGRHAVIIGAVTSGFFELIFELGTWGSRMQFNFNVGNAGRFSNRNSRNSSAPPSVAGRIFMSLFFAVFLGMGLFFVYMISQDFREALATRSWTPTQAVVTLSETSPGSNGDHEFHIRYSYPFNGTTYVSNSYDKPAKDGTTSDDFADLQKLAMQYPVDATLTVYVNPANPQQSVVVRRSLWSGFAMLFPMVFVLIGAGGIYFTWRGKSSQDKPTAAVAAQAVRSKNAGRGIVTLLGVIFTAVGLIVGYFLVVRPLLHVQSAKAWPAVAAKVISSDVVSHHSDDGTTYSIDIVYEYVINDQTFRSNRYDFISGSSSGYDGKRAIVRKHPAGKRINVFVNPADPTDAVIVRDMTSGFLIGLVPAVFFLAGVGMLFGASRMGKGKKGEAGPAWLPRTGATDAAPDGEMELKRSSSPFGKLMGITLFAVIWNGITSVFVYKAVTSHLEGDPEWFLTFFIIPFVLIGLGTLCGVVYCFLAMFNPKLVLRVNTASPAVGDSLVIDWMLEGRADRISHLTISLEAEERATYRRGTDTVTDKHTLYSETLYETSDLAAIMQGGRVEALIPADAMHSFDASNNKIIWELKCHGDIRRWPDVNDAYNLVVRPMPAPEDMSHG